MEIYEEKYKFWDEVALPDIRMILQYPYKFTFKYIPVTASLIPPTKEWQMQLYMKWGHVTSLDKNMLIFN